MEKKRANFLLFPFAICFCCFLFAIGCLGPNGKKSKFFSIYPKHSTNNSAQEQQKIAHCAVAGLPASARTVCKQLPCVGLELRAAAGTAAQPASCTGRLPGWATRPASRPAGRCVRWPRAPVSRHAPRAARQAGSSQPRAAPAERACAWRGRWPRALLLAAARAQRHVSRAPSHGLCPPRARLAACSRAHRGLLARLCAVGRARRPRPSCSIDLPGRTRADRNRREEHEKYRDFNLNYSFKVQRIQIRFESQMRNR
jgi:hypothetical protein